MTPVSYGAETEEDIKPLSRKFTYASGTSREFKAFFHKQIQEISKIDPIGRILIEKLNKLAEKIPQKIVVKDTRGGEKTSFVSHADPEKDFNGAGLLKDEWERQDLDLNINLDDAIYVVGLGLCTAAECIGPLRKIGNHEVFEVGTAYSPFYVAITHELIHLKHFLETLTNDMVITHYGLAVSIKNYDLLEKSSLDLPIEANEMKVVRQLRRELPWVDFEERRTVLGPDIDNVSELTFRVNARFPIRYIYQGIDKFWYELRRVVEVVLQDAQIDPKVLMANPEYLPRTSGVLSPGIPEDSVMYLPLEIKLALYADDRILTLLNIRKEETRRTARAFLQQKREKL